MTGYARFVREQKEKRLQAEKFLCIIKTLWLFAQDKPLACDKKYGRNARGCA